MTAPLSGLNVLVTGATGAIGRAITVALAAEGARVGIHYGRDRDGAERLLRSIDGRGWCLQADLSSPGGATQLWVDAEAISGRLHGLVNNAGIRTEVSVEAPLPDWQSAWDREMRVNLLSAADLCKCAIAHFRRHGPGRIVNIASRAGQRGYSADALAYGASKAALINLTKSIAQSFGAEGITATALAPGWVRTEMAEAFIARHGEAAALAGIPVGQMAEPAEIGELVAFALRPSQVSLNGAVLDVNGGSYLR
ncbi:SDR family NAD(P)-dependent oxidoreductase [Rubellimicrobium arenae]|uniref:SDR family NAD(P)-dependent oxidoreductase n=1 Tax=Rubellimicrobium arenae TaxID=2817372 RepID=UPI001B30E9C0|nr:SDR family NAD(P)-dependent oxidoreductase [Rubellimicrobium arenae]